MKESFKSNECPALLLLRLRVSWLLCWTEWHPREWAVAQKVISQWGHTPEKACPRVRFVSKSQTKTQGAQTRKSSSATEGHSESKSLITEKDTKGTVNIKICNQKRKRPVFYILTLIICLQVWNFTFAMTCFLLHWVLFAFKFYFSLIMRKFCLVLTQIRFHRGGAGETERAQEKRTTKYHAYTLRDITVNSQSTTAGTDVYLCVYQVQCWFCLGYEFYVPWCSEPSYCMCNTEDQR